MSSDDADRVLRLTGGASVGNACASWPLATLRVSEGHVVIHLPFVEHSFAPRDVVALEVRSGLLGLASEVRILHRRDDVPARVHFQVLRSKPRLDVELERAGFVGQAPRGTEKPSAQWRLAFVAGVFLASFALVQLCLSGGGHIETIQLFSGPLVVAFMWRLPASKRLQRLALRPGSHVEALRTERMLFALAAGMATLVVIAEWLKETF